MNNTPLSVFGDDGVDIGDSARNITYLYGLSDFFAYLFEDTETLNILLEANAISASEIYSRFLQLTSSLSLENIQTFTGASLKLVLITAADQEDSSLPVYTINLPVEKVKLITNRPFLPTEILEENVDFRVTRKDINSSYIHFAKHIFDDPAPYRFSSRTNPSGVREYAVWFTDVLLDEQLMMKHFGSLISITPEISSEAFSNFIYGLYYIYLNGPTIGLLKRGLNLVIGAPLARSNEVVLDIRGYLGSDQFLIITDQNQYLLPFGLTPSVSVGDEISLGQLLAEWIELKDYSKDGAWWIDVSIPASLIPVLPPQQANRFAVAGSPYDTLMRNYLYKNSFLVKVNVGNFKNTQQFAQISDIINRAKPSHTQPIYVWAVPDEDLTIQLLEEDTIKVEVNTIEHVGEPIDLFRRNNLTSPVYRGGAFFNRRCVPFFVAELVGENPELGQNQRNYFNAGGTSVPVSGFRAYKAAITTLGTYDRAWVQDASSDGNYMYNQQANQYSALGLVTPTIPEGTPSFKGFSDTIVPGRRVVALYTTFLTDVQSKMTTLGLSLSPTNNRTSFNIGGSSGYLISNYATLMTKGTGLGSLGPEFPKYSYETFTPLVGDIGSMDYLICFRITELVVGVYWVTQNTTKIAPSLIPIQCVDPLEIHYDVPFNRSSGIGGQPWYLTRGGALVNSGDIVGSYTDIYNTTPIVTNRSMGAPDWPTTGSLTLVHHVTKA